MKSYIKVSIICSISIIAISGVSRIPKEEKQVLEDSMISLNIKIDDNSPSCLQMYYYIDKYAKKYNIPLNYAYGIAFAETTYEGPYDWNYKHNRKSSAGAIGPMQIMPATANMMWPDEKISKKKLMNNVEFNVETSMKLLNILYEKHEDWKLVFGCYNTGKPCINNYALKVYNYKPSFTNI